MTIEESWLKRQIEKVREDVKELPSWLRAPSHPPAPTLAQQMLMKHAIRLNTSLVRDGGPVYRCQECQLSWFGTRADHPREEECAVWAALSRESASPLRDSVARLLSYAVHHDTCSRRGLEGPCSCGLSRLCDEDTPLARLLAAGESASREEAQHGHGEQVVQRREDSARLTGADRAGHDAEAARLDAPAVQARVGAEARGETATPGAVAEGDAAAPVADNYDEAHRYLSRLLAHVAPHIRPNRRLVLLCTQIDNYIAGQHQRAEAAEARLRTVEHAHARLRGQFARCARELNELLAALPTEATPHA